jgi:DNA modification methylase
MIFTSGPYWPSFRDYDVPPVIFGGDPACAHEWRDLPPLKHTSPGDVPSKGSMQGNRPNDKVNRVVKGSEWCERCEAWRGQFGHEPIGQLFIEHSMLFINECWRILADDGSLWWNIGDAHAGSGGAGGDWNNGKRANAIKWRGSRDVQTNIRDRSLFMTPSRMQVAIVEYGWIVPNVIIWRKEVPYPYSGDRRFTIDYEPVIWCVKTLDYKFNQQKDKRVSKGRPVVGGKKYTSKKGRENSGHGMSGKLPANTEERNMRAVWDIPASRFRDPFAPEHFAPFPQELPRIPIRACTNKGDIVCDIFSGLGTTCCEAKYQGRQWVGIELNEQYAAYSEKRIARQKVGADVRTKKKALDDYQ